MKSNSSLSHVRHTQKHIYVTYKVSVTNGEQAIMHTKILLIWSHTNSDLHLSGAVEKNIQFKSQITKINIVTF